MNIKKTFFANFVLEVQTLLFASKYITFSKNNSTSYYKSKLWILLYIKYTMVQAETE